MNNIFLGIGSNLGDKLRIIQNSLQELMQIGQICMVSSLYQSPAWGVVNQPDYFNLVLEINSLLQPYELLSYLHQIEYNNGRERSFRWAARTLDIDILYFNDFVIQEPSLKIPHERLPLRKFVLEPLAEIAPYKVHPVLQKNHLELLSICPDASELRCVYHQDWQNFLHENIYSAENKKALLE
ncbi:MAG: 2-amino-4-hydroxy-6-hydroxymethyldihydropteridine diphosphokinase [Cytophagales bacterium]|nr:2-amino-4-hydroxy-6-hydroxymethyldihydropteridine diphosphokinase [Cytophagales bacterium]MDW8384337.1 2-amino-4-hydroxy-6-hydroxymethyldihydropteridine diphosphokinase [Flammeovirgaceae bacterium]